MVSTNGNRSSGIIGRVRRRIAEKGAMQNTKLQKYIRGADDDRTRAVRVSIVYHLQYEQHVRIECN